MAVAAAGGQGSTVPQEPGTRAASTMSENFANRTEVDNTHSL